MIFFLCRENLGADSPALFPEKVMGRLIEPLRFLLNPPQEGMNIEIFILNHLTYPL